MLRGASSLAACARARVRAHAPADAASARPQFGIELDDVTTEKQILRKEHQKADEAAGEDEEVRGANTG